MELTIVFVSHDLRAVTSISDRIACLNLTLHYHDVPDHMPADLVFSMFGCDLAAMGLEGKLEHAHADCGHEHGTGRMTNDQIPMTNK
jgi:ABC-type Mn2+/Zn2+ transport system ATPase subunit